MLSIAVTNALQRASALSYHLSSTNVISVMRQISTCQASILDGLDVLHCTRINCRPNCGTQLSSWQAMRARKSSIGPCPSMYLSVCIRSCGLSCVCMHVSEVDQDGDHAMCCRCYHQQPSRRNHKCQSQSQQLRDKRRRPSPSAREASWALAGALLRYSVGHSSVGKHIRYGSRCALHMALDCLRISMGPLLPRLITAGPSFRSPPTGPGSGWMAVACFLKVCYFQCLQNLSQ